MKSEDIECELKVQIMKRLINSAIYRNPCAHVHALLPYFSNKFSYLAIKSSHSANHGSIWLCSIVVRFVSC